MKTKLLVIYYHISHVTSEAKVLVRYHTQRVNKGNKCSLWSGKNIKNAFVCVRYKNVCSHFWNVWLLRSHFEPKANKHNSNWQLDDIPNRHHNNLLTSVRFPMQPAQHAARKSDNKSCVSIQNKLQKSLYNEVWQPGNYSCLTLVASKIPACFHSLLLFEIWSTFLIIRKIFSGLFFFIVWRMKLNEKSLFCFNAWNSFTDFWLSDHKIYGRLGREMRSRQRQTSLGRILSNQTSTFLPVSW